MPFSPYDAAQHTIKRAEALIRLSARLSRRKELTQHLKDASERSARDDLRRLALVMAVAALDTYMHRLIVTQAYAHTNMPKKLADLTMRFEDLVEQADQAVIARKENRSARPKVAAKRLLRERLARETFQKHERVSEALAMAGKSQKWDAIAAAMPDAPTPAGIKARLNEIVERRNAIVHEGDYRRLDRPQRASLVDITPGEARDAVAFLSDLIDAIHTTIQ